MEENKEEMAHEPLYRYPKIELRAESLSIMNCEELLNAASSGEELKPGSLDMGIVMSARTQMDNTALHIALSYGRAESARALYVKCPSLLWKQNKQNETPLHLAASSWDLKVLMWLEDLLTTNFNVEREDGKDWPLQEQQELLRVLDADENSALHRLAMTGPRTFSVEDLAFMEKQTEVVRKMLGVDGNLSGCVNKAGESPLYLAASVGSTKMLDVLLQWPSPAVGNGGPFGRTALHAVIRCCVRVNVEEILNKRPEYMDACDDLNWTPLHFAAAFNNISTVRVLLDRGCSILILNQDNGDSPIHIAAAMGFLGVLKALVDKHPDCLGLLNSRGRNALHVAVEKGRREITKYILAEPQFGALVNQRDADGNAPLQLIKRDDWRMLALFLLDKRVQLFAENHRGERIVDELAGNFKGTARFYWFLFGAATSGRSYYRTHFLSALSDWRKITYYKRVQKLSLVATLVATITFTVGISAPGGFVSDAGPDQGLPVLRRKPAFKAFICLDTLAMLCSLTVAGMSIIDIELLGVFASSCLTFAVFIIHIALILMVWAFVCAIYLLLDPSSSSIVILVVLFCSVFVLLYSAIWLPPFLKSWWRMFKIRSQSRAAARLSTNASAEHT